MKIAALLVLAALPARADPLGLSLEAQFGVVLGEDAQGSSSGVVAGGARAGIDLLRGGGLDLRTELSWLHWSKEEGTDAVRVTPTFDALLLALRAGPRLGSPNMELVPYALAGPMLTFVGSEYLVEDPLGRSTSPSASGVEVGPGYGLGLAVLGGDPAGLRFAGRLEGSRLHRGANAEVVLQMALGIEL